MFGYEVFNILRGNGYQKAIFGLDIPYLYQTEKIYTMYCFFLSLWFLLLCVFGVITALKNKKVVPIIMSLLFLATLELLILLNGRY